MNFAHRITNSPNPQAAMLVLAEGIDEVLARLDAVPVTPASDPWGSWDVNNGGPAGDASGSVSNDDGRAAQRPVVDNTAAIAAVEQALVTEADPETRLALEARLRLLKDEGQAIDVNPVAGEMAQQTDEGDTVVTHLPTPGVDRQNARRGFARGNKLWEFSVLTEQEFVDAFAKGGPLWLYHTARDEVMAMPAEWRRMFVDDIALDSPRTAQEVGRDILKDEGTGNKDVALSALGVDSGD